MQKEHFEVVLESIESKIQLVLECFSTLDKKIDDVRDELKDDVALLDVKITELSGRIDAVDTKLDKVETNLTRRLDAVDTRLDGIDTRLDGIDTRLDGIDTRLDGIDTRLDKVETNLTNQIDAVHSELVAHRGSVELHKLPRRRVLKQV